VRRREVRAAVDEAAQPDSIAPRERLSARPTKAGRDGTGKLGRQTKWVSAREGFTDKQRLRICRKRDNAVEGVMMIGTEDQVKRAEQIKVRINAEFDRIARALESAAGKQNGRDRVDTEAVIVILEDKRTDVMAKGQASYFLNNWRELNDRVRQLITQDSRYLAINTRKAMRDR
jgi:hypothetical protein